MLNQTLTLVDSEANSIAFERTANAGQSSTHTALARNLGSEETIKVDHRIVGKGDARVRQTRVRIDVNRLNATTGKSGNVNMSFLINVPQSGLAIQDADVQYIIGLAAQMILSPTQPENAAADATLGKVLSEGSL